MRPVYRLSSRYTCEPLCPLVCQVLRTPANGPGKRVESAKPTVCKARPTQCDGSHRMSVGFAAPSTAPLHWIHASAMTVAARKGSLRRGRDLLERGHWGPSQGRRSPQSRQSTRPPSWSKLSARLTPPRRPAFLQRLPLPRPARGRCKGPSKESRRMWFCEMKPMSGGGGLQQGHVHRVRSGLSVPPPDVLASRVPTLRALAEE